MRTKARIATTATPALLLLALAGCTPGGDPSGGGSDPATDDTACLTGATWLLDVQDGARQLAENLSSNGIQVLGSEGAGRHELNFTGDGLVSSDIDITYTITAALTGGLTLTMVQTQSGAGGGEWAWLDDSGVIQFADWDNGDFQVQTQTFINDTASPNTTTIPSETLGGTDMEVLACSDGTLSTHVVSSPFTQLWHSAD